MHFLSKIGRFNVRWIGCSTSQSTIFQSYMRTEEEVGPTVWLPTPYTFRRVILRASPNTDTGPPFLYGDSDTPPHLVAFYYTLGIRRTHSRLNPPGPHGGIAELKDPFLPLWCHLNKTISGFWEGERTHRGQSIGKCRLGLRDRRMEGDITLFEDVTIKGIFIISIIYTHFVYMYII